MNRRALFSTILSPQAATRTDRSQATHTATERPFAASTDLTPYGGTWGFAEAAHLLRRAMFAPTFEQIQDAVNDGLSTTLDKLFTIPPMPAPPLNNNNEDDPLVEIGETWVNAVYTVTDGNNITKGYRAASLRGWTADVIKAEGVSIREKMTLFWHNHFPTAGLNNPNVVYRYITLLRSNALGNFRDLAKDITIDPAMLRYLNGDQNSVEFPNENYARELLELFTIGKGELAAPEDYTNYTEGDIAAAAKVLTGWRISNFNNVNPELELNSFFRNNRHDQTDKQFSHRFNHAIIANNGADEYKDLVDMIFGQAEVARYICREFYRWFVYYDIDDNIETNVIQPLADDLMLNDYDVAPTIRKLLESEHFFAEDNVGCMIKNPYDFVMSAMKSTHLEFPTDPALNQFLTNRLMEFTDLLQMRYYEPPSVSGWKAYYQEPQFYRMWINSVTLPDRFNFTNLLVGATEPITVQGFTIQIDVLGWMDSIFTIGGANPYDVNIFIGEFAKLLLPKALSDSQTAYFKEILIPGLPDFEWSVEYDNYQQNLEDETIVMAMANKLRLFVNAFFTLPEFQLM